MLISLRGSKATMRNFRIALVTVASLLALLIGGGLISAIARGYTTDDTSLQIGMVAALSAEGANTVERADYDNQKRIVGIVVSPDVSTVTLGSGDSRLFVEAEGEVDAYVSDGGGVIKRGDLLALSPIRGVLTKAQEGSGQTIIAIAAASTQDSAQSSVHKLSTGSDAIITKIKVNLNTQGLSTAQGQDDSPIAKLGRSIVGKDVGEPRVIIALVLFVIVLIAEGGIIYGAVSSAITALGRNPLARKAIARELLQVSIVAILVLAVGLGAVYAVLWV